MDARIDVCTKVLISVLPIMLIVMLMAFTFTIAIVAQGTGLLRVVTRQWWRYALTVRIAIMEMPIRFLATIFQTTNELMGTGVANLKGASGVSRLLTGIKPYCELSFLFTMLVTLCGTILLFIYCHSAIPTYFYFSPSFL